MTSYATSNGRACPAEMKGPFREGIRKVIVANTFKYHNKILESGDGPFYYGVKVYSFLYSMRSR